LVDVADPKVDVRVLIKKHDAQVVHHLVTQGACRIHAHRALSPPSLPQLQNGPPRAPKAKTDGSKGASKKRKHPPSPSSPLPRPKKKADEEGAAEEGEVKEDEMEEGEVEEEVGEVGDEPGSRATTSTEGDMDDARAYEDAKASGDRARMDQLLFGGDSD